MPNQYLTTQLVCNQSVRNKTQPSATAAIPLLLAGLLSSLLSTCGAIAAPPLPRDGLIMHLESTAGVETSGFQSSKRKVKNWWDQSGYGQDLASQGSPVVANSGPGGKPALEFHTGYDALRQIRTSSLPTFGNDRTLFVLSAPGDENSSIGYGKRGSSSSFSLEHDTAGYSALSTGCKKSRMHATGQQPTGQWRLNTLVLNAGNLYHLRDGELVDGRDRRFTTGTGPFLIRLPDLQRKATLAKKAGRKVSRDASSNTPPLRVAAVLMYNWALGQREIRQVQRYLSKNYYGNPNKFRNPPNLSNVTFPEPHMNLQQTVQPNGHLELSWRVSFADECSAENGWNNNRTTSGSKIIRKPIRGSSYSMNCWHSRASASANFSTDLRPLRLSWRQSGSVVPTGYRVFLGTRPGNYDRALKLPANPTNSHTLQLPAGTYYLAMSSLGYRGRESGLSGELTVTVH